MFIQYMEPNVARIDKQLERVAKKPVLPLNVRACVICAEPLFDGLCPVCYPGKMHVIRAKAQAFFMGAALPAFFMMALVFAFVMAMGGPQIFGGL